MLKFRIFLFIFFLLISAGRAFAFEWKEEKDKHFIVKFTSSSDGEWAREVLRKAEDYYTVIARQIGYARYGNFWTWEDRVNIVLYPDQVTYIKETGLPSWSRGGATTYHRQLRTRAIVSFIQENAFLDNVLPHEISHLILADFLGGANIPNWFNEGVAQLQESGKQQEADMFMRKAVRKGTFIPFQQLISSDSVIMQDARYATFFYAQSVSMVYFLIQEYGSQEFGELCRQLRDGNSFETSLLKVYTTLISSIGDFEQKWLYSMGN
ncbi:MAG: hypothetical protein KBD53_05755 [Candidatus Omnitrophica bacterium]|nr:hypothetical protein [Candidatus Omnitrophota bacterium]